MYLVGIGRVGVPVDGQMRMGERLERLMQHRRPDTVEPRALIGRTRSCATSNRRAFQSGVNARPLS